MSTLTDFTAQAQDATVSAIRTAQDLTVQYVSQISETLANVTPDLPASPVAFPSARELADAAFGFAGAVLEASKQFALAVADAVSPLTDKVSDTV